MPGTDRGRPELCTHQKMAAQKERPPRKNGEGAAVLLVLFRFSGLQFAQAFFHLFLVDMPGRI